MEYERKKVINLNEKTYGEKELYLTNISFSIQTGETKLLIGVMVPVSNLLNVITRER